MDAVFIVDDSYVRVDFIAADEVIVCVSSRHRLACIVDSVLPVCMDHRGWSTDDPDSACFVCVSSLVT